MTLLADKALNRRDVATVVLLGDSHCANNGGSNDSATSRMNRARGFWTWASTRLGKRLRLLNNSGVGGERSDQILARVQSGALAYSPGWVIVTAGVNDINQDVPIANIKANITSICDALLAGGCRVVLTTTPPFDSFTTARRDAQAALNRWIKQQGERRSVTVVDWFAALAKSDGTWQTGLSYDGTHGGATGCARMGKVMADILDPIVPRFDPLPGFDDNVSLVANGSMSGTAGAGGTGVTGSIATGWTVSNWNGSTTTVCSKVARTDGYGGEWQQLAVSAGTGVRIQRTVKGGSWAIGDTIVGACEFQMDSDVTVSTLTDFYLQVEAATTFAASLDLKNAGSDSMNDPTCRITSGVLLTTPLLINPGSTDITFRLIMTGATGTFRASRFDLYKV